MYLLSNFVLLFCWVGGGVFAQIEIVRLFNSALEASTAHSELNPNHHVHNYQ